ncbi:MAG: hypothetical protein HC905_19695 [Bacteroidales bacterium]|nr:hypothetical protein [Bacteroidales bacterium]
MEFLILNEESVPFKTIQDANEKFPGFITIVVDAFANRFKTIRVSEKIGKNWFELQICKDLPLREWLKGKDKELERKIKVFISKTDFPQIPLEMPNIKRRFEGCDFYLLDKPHQLFPSLSIAYLLKQLSISFESEVLWQRKNIEATKCEIIGDELTEEIVKIDNVSLHSTWLEYITEFEAQRKSNLRKGKELWENRSLEFKNLIFCGNSEKDFKGLSISDTIFGQLWNVLKTLDAYCLDSTNDYSLKSIQDKTKLDISDESDSVKQNPKLAIYRKFTVNSVSLFFGFHVKNFSGAMRLHFLPDRENRKILIGYFGKHLPTKRDPK